MFSLERGKPSGESGNFPCSIDKCNSIFCLIDDSTPDISIKVDRCSSCARDWGGLINHPTAIRLVANKIAKRLDKT